MSRKVLSITLGVYLSMFFAGCSQQANLSLSPKTGTVNSYAFSLRTLVDYKFEQATLGKLDEKQTGTTVDMTFDQEITGVDEEGATAKITITSLKYMIKAREGVKLDFDSSKPEEKGALGKLIGQSYTIKLLSNGSVKLIDAKAIRKVPVPGYEGRVKDAILDEKRIIARHEILAIPANDGAALSKNDTWDKIVESHPGLKWAPKSFSKTYTLTDISEQGGKKLAHVTMDATESTEDGSAEANLFANLFDPDESYTGELVLDLNSGTVIKYNEEFIGIYIAQEMPKDGDEEKGPDTLMMGFTNSVSLEKID